MNRRELVFPAVRNVSGRVVFCDLSYEGGASGLAFADACRRLPHAGIAYLGICPIEEMQDTARRMFQAEGYQAVQAFSMQGWKTCRFVLACPRHGFRTDSCSMSPT